MKESVSKHYNYGEESAFTKESQGEHYVRSTAVDKTWQASPLSLPVPNDLSVNLSIPTITLLSLISTSASNSSFLTSSLSPTHLLFSIRRYLIIPPFNSLPLSLTVTPQHTLLHTFTLTS